MRKRTEDMKLSSAGLLLLLTAAAMTLFADFGPRTDGFKAPHLPSQHSLR